MDTLLAISRDPAWASIGVIVSVIALLVTSVISIKTLPRNVKPNQTELTKNISSSASINLPRQVSQPYDNSEFKNHISASNKWVQPHKGTKTDKSTKISFSFWGSLIIFSIYGSIEHYLDPVPFSSDLIKNYTSAGGFYRWATYTLFLGLIILYNHLIWTNFLSTATSTSKLRAKIGALLYILFSFIQYSLIVSKIIDNDIASTILGGILGGSFMMILLLIKSSKDNLPEA